MKKIRHKQSEKTKKKRKETTSKFWKSPEGLFRKQKIAKRLIKERKDKTYEQIYGERAQEIKNKIGNGQRGIPKSKEHNQKNKEAHEGKKREPFSDKWRENLRKAQMIRIQNGTHNFYKGGISFEKYGQDWTEDLKDSIRKRDNHVCQMEGCGIHQDELEQLLDVHHIDYNKKNCNPKNLISFCRKCHIKTNHNREHWLKYFNNKLYE